MLTTGQGWRLGYRPGQYPYCALVGGSDWAFELTEAEWHDFVAASRSLVQAWVAVAPHLMPDEATTLEQSVGSVQLRAEGQPQAYSLYLQTTSGRRCEGEWPAAVVPELLQTLLSWSTS